MSDEKIKKETDKLLKEFEETKHLYRDLGHFCDIKNFELLNDIDHIRDNLTIGEVDKMMRLYNQNFNLLFNSQFEND